MSAMQHQTWKIPQEPTRSEPDAWRRVANTMATYRTLDEREAKDLLWSWRSKTCRHCQRQFWGRGGVRLCSVACRRAARNLNSKRKREAAKASSLAPQEPAPLADLASGINSVHAAVLLRRLPREPTARGNCS